jgi:nucleoside-diphosphate-sugar epimerase
MFGHFYQQPRAGKVYNVGGWEVSASLLGLTRHCRDIMGRAVPIQPEPTTSPVDVRIYLTDHQRATRAFDWQPRRTVAQIVADIAAWVRGNEEVLRPLLT